MATRARVAAMTDAAEWLGHVQAIERDRYLFRAYGTRLVLRGLAWASAWQESRIVEVGRRTLAVACNLDDTTVAVSMRQLVAEQDPLVRVVAAGGGAKPRTYELSTAEGRPRVEPTLVALHPALRVVSRPAVFLYEALARAAEPMRPDELAGLAGVVSGRATSYSLRQLASQDLATSAGGRWSRAPDVDLTQLAIDNGGLADLTDHVDAVVAERMANFTALFGDRWMPVPGHRDELLYQARESAPIIPIRGTGSRR